MQYSQRFAEIFSVFVHFAEIRALAPANAKSGHMTASHIYFYISPLGITARLIYRGMNPNKNTPLYLYFVPSMGVELNLYQVLQVIILLSSLSSCKGVAADAFSQWLICRYCYLPYDNIISHYWRFVNR